MEGYRMSVNKSRFNVLRFQKKKIFLSKSGFLFLLFRMHFREVYSSDYSDQSSAVAATSVSNNKNNNSNNSNNSNNNTDNSLSRNSNQMNSRSANTFSGHSDNNMSTSLGKLLDIYFSTVYVADYYQIQN
jgi:hypothetical protein